MIVQSHRFSLFVATGLLVMLWHKTLFAASTDLDNVPLTVKSTVAPNIMLMLDSSGSMNNIVPDTPYNDSITYTNCPSGNILEGGADTIDGLNSNNTLDVRIKNSDGAVTITVSGAGAGKSGRAFGTGTNQLCFDSTKKYNARLLANGTSGSNNVPSNYLDAVYKGNYLNWYFCTGTAPNCNTAANFGAGAKRKPGTQNRLEIARIAANNIVDSLDTVRIGLSRYNASGNGDGGQLAVPIDLNTPTQKTTLKTAISGLTASGATPLAETLSGIAGYFAKRSTSDNGTETGTGKSLTLHPGNSTSGNVPATLNQSAKSAKDIFTSEGTYPLVGATTAAPPIQAYCQKSFAVLMTDGKPQSDEAISDYLCDYLGVTGSCSRRGQLVGMGNGTGGNIGYHVYAPGGTGAVASRRLLHVGGPIKYESMGSGYLVNVAKAAFEMNLRPDLDSTKPPGVVSKNNLLTYTVSFADEEAINDPIMQMAAREGGGLFFSANNSAELVRSFELAFDDILAKDSSGAAVAVANAQVTTGDNASYSTSYNSGSWTGDLIGYPIDIVTGNQDVNNPIWNTGCPNPTALVDPADASKGVQGCSAQVQLDLKAPATRKIITSNDNSSCLFNCGIPFQPTTATGSEGVDKLSAAQQTRLNTPSQTDGAAVVNYLRGDTSGDVAGIYRNRAHILGDNINSEPEVVRAPSLAYADSGYLDFKNANASRTGIVLQASNDGMLHAFNAATGAEEWAYIPNILISDSRDPLNASTSLLNTRTNKVGFRHYYLMDATPVSNDVDFGKTVGAPTGDNWRTIVVGGLGKGGRGYYALDVTTTTATTEAEAKTKVLWEFPRSISDATIRARVSRDLGFGFGKPIIVKTQAAGWVVLVASGYNNGTNSGDSGGDGLAHLFVINPRTGDLIADLKTPACNTAPAANPCGMAHINAYSEDKNTNNLAELVYGGDLYGNVWRFDIRGTNMSNWRVSKLATLRSGPAATDPVQPITTVPELAKVDGKYFVYVGTGKYLGQTDLLCPPPTTCAWTPNSQAGQTQTMYGLVDPRTGSTNPESMLASLPEPLRPALQAQTVTTTGESRSFSTNAVDFTTQKGFYIDFTGGAGERIVSDPALAAGTLVFTTNVPSITPCIPGGSSFINFIDYKTGGNLTANGLTLTGGKKLKDALASRPTLIQLPDGKIKAIVRLSDTTSQTIDVPIADLTFKTNRVSWRELIDQ